MGTLANSLPACVALHRLSDSRSLSSFAVTVDADDSQSIPVRDGERKVSDQVTIRFLHADSLEIYEYAHDSTTPCGRKSEVW